MRGIWEATAITYTWDDIDIVAIRMTSFLPGSWVQLDSLPFWYVPRLDTIGHRPARVRGDSSSSEHRIVMNWRSKDNNDPVGYCGGKTKFWRGSHRH